MSAPHSGAIAPGTQQTGPDATTAPRNAPSFIPASPRVLAFAQDAFRQHVETLLDDPCELLHPWRDREPADALAELRTLAADLGFDFDELTATGSESERDRLTKIESGEIAPAPAAPLRPDPTQSENTTAP